MQKMKIPGVSVLSQNTPQDLTNPCLFTEAVQEMISNCEFLYDILNAALGDKISETSKIAIIATVYGMFLHSNNNKISAVQPGLELGFAIFANGEFFSNVAKRNLNVAKILFL